MADLARNALVPAIGDGVGQPDEGRASLQQCHHVGPVPARPNDAIDQPWDPQYHIGHRILLHLQHFAGLSVFVLCSFAVSGVHGLYTPSPPLSPPPPPPPYLLHPPPGNTNGSASKRKKVLLMSCLARRDGRFRSGPPTAVVVREWETTDLTRGGKGRRAQVPGHIPNVSEMPSEEKIQIAVERYDGDDDQLSPGAGHSFLFSIVDPPSSHQPLLSFTHLHLSAVWYGIGSTTGITKSWIYRFGGNPAPPARTCPVPAPAGRSRRAPSRWPV